MQLASSCKSYWLDAFYNLIQNWISLGFQSEKTSYLRIPSLTLWGIFHYFLTFIREKLVIKKITCRIINNKILCSCIPSVSLVFLHNCPETSSRSHCGINQSVKTLIRCSSVKLLNFMLLLFMFWHAVCFKISFVFGLVILTLGTCHFPHSRLPQLSASTESTPAASHLLCPGRKSLLHNSELLRNIPTRIRCKSCTVLLP